MIIDGQKFTIVEHFDTSSTVPDCMVVAKNKLGGGHGEAKLYIAPKEKMREFYGGKGFNARCFVLKKDLIAYLNAIKTEYLHPSQDYRGRDELATLWQERMAKVEQLNEVVEFNIQDQVQIQGPRGYVNSSDDGYNLIRELSLPLVSYISAMELADKQGTPIYYWKLFADFEAISDKASALVFRYGKKEEQQKGAGKREMKKDNEVRKARVGQGSYREKLLNECAFCPITMINEEELLVASHIKPWAVSNDRERIDPKNGFILSPLFDKLFDRGYITFTDDRRVKITHWLSQRNIKRIGIKDNEFFQMLPVDEERKRYLAYHRECVFRG